MRKFQVEDLFRLQQLGERYYGSPFSFSPDGQSLAYVLQRPKESTTLHKWPRLMGNDRADIWLVDLPGGTAWSLTNGLSDGSGYWAPTWSLDGEHLAMLSTKGGNVTLWVWEQATGQLRQMTRRGIHLAFDRLPYAWLSSETILCPVLPEGKQPEPMSLESRAAETAMRAWPKAWAGQEPTASVLESGVSGDWSGRPQGQLLLINVTDGSSQLLATGITPWSVTQVLALAPDKQWLAFLQEVAPSQPEPNAPLDFGGQYRFTIGVVSTAGDASKLIQHDVSHDVVGGSLCWSRDGSELAFVSYRESRAVPPHIYSFRPTDGSVDTFGSGRLDSSPPDEDPKLRWSSQGKLLVYAAPTTGATRARPGTRRDWWVVNRDGNERNLTAEMQEPPTEILAEHGRTSFVGLSKGNLWRIHPDGSPPENLTEDLAAKLTDIAWSGQADNVDGQTAPTIGAGVARLIVGAQSGEQTGYYLVDLPAISIQELPKPTSEATVASYDPVGATLLFSANDHTGTYLWSAQHPYRDFNLILETNTFLRDITPGEHRQIKYRSLEGEDLTGWLLLPPDYQPGQQYPLVTEVYPEFVYESSPSSLDEINNPQALNLQLLAANGYVVLHPSMPLGPQGEADDPMLKLTNGVLPAVERVVELGIADPDRVFLMGHSYGGYGTYGLVTQTHRFKAAIALAGSCDLISHYGTFDARIRYDDHPHEDFFEPAFMESGQARMGSPPWKDLGRYLRNNPIFYVERVQTPVLIIQGDLDFIPLQQGEEFFVSLYRQGKRAVFVRYWGEGHVLESPANIRDIWQRILAWFEEFAEVQAS